MKIYTEVIYRWDDAKGELVEESSKSFDYHGPLTLCVAPAVAYGAYIAAAALAIQVYSIWKGNKAAEEAADAEREHQARIKALAIRKYKMQEGQAATNLTLVARQESRTRDIAKDVLFEEELKALRARGKLDTAPLMEGNSSKFFASRHEGDFLRRQTGIKKQFDVKLEGIENKKFKVMDQLKYDRLNMDYTIAGLAPVQGPDQTSMYLAYGQAGLDAVGTYYKYRSWTSETA